MRLPDLFRTTAFRLTLMYMALFTVSVLVLLGFVYWNTISYLNQQTDSSIQTELDGLLAQYRQTGLEGLRRNVLARTIGGHEVNQLYLLTDRQYTPLAGNLPAWPGNLRGRSGWADMIVSDFEGQTVSTEEVNQGRALSVSLPGAYHLLVGRDLDEHTLQALAIALAISLALALLGGLVMSRSILRRIAAINHTSRAIMAGHLEQRMAISGSQDEFDQLAGNLNAMLDQIQRLMEAMRQVTDNVAHDLRSPLSRLRSRLEVSLLAPRSDEEYRVVIEQTLADAEALLHTFNALLSIAQAEADTDSKHWEPLDLSMLLRDLAEFYQPLAEENDLCLRQDIADGLTLSGNRHLLVQAIGNLLDNAIKYTAQGGTVGLGATWQSSGIEISVRDNGSGIPASEREHVLQRFVRLEPSRSTPGNGLGLSLVRAVAQLHHAKLELHDNAPGLKVSVLFPADLHG